MLKNVKLKNHMFIKERHTEKNKDWLQSTDSPIDYNSIVPDNQFKAPIACAWLPSLFIQEREPKDRLRGIVCED